MSKPLFCIIGESGSGKSTLCDEMLEYGYKQIPSYTTRPCRNEKDKLGHTFVSMNEFNQLQDVIAYNETTGNKYGITSKQIDNEEYELYVVDYSGIKTLKSRYKGDRKIIGVFIDCPAKQRQARLMFRYLNEERDYIRAVDKSMHRILSDIDEFNGAKDYCDFYISNSDNELEEAKEKLLNLIRTYSNNIFANWKYKKSESWCVV